MGHLLYPHFNWARLPCRLIGILLWSQTTWAANYHLVGWINTFVPGGGQLLLGNPGRASLELLGETVSFGYGFSLSKRSPLTIDGVPEGYPGPSVGYGKKSRTVRVCPPGKYSPALRRCTVPLVPVSTTSTFQTFDLTPENLSVPVAAAFLQELGLKAHMMNVFESYRSAAKANGKLNEGQGIDDRNEADFLLDPFRGQNLLNPWVYIPLLLSTGYIAYDFSSQLKQLASIQALTPGTNRFIAFNQTVLYPFGSGAPEEMFYRGFLQNEAYCLVQSPFFSVAASTAAFSFSHTPDGRVGAAVTGAYLGFLAHHFHGTLGPAITLHFWSVLVLGIEAYLLTHRSQQFTAPPTGLTASLTF